jgi:hypothetical protein
MNYQNQYYNNQQPPQQPLQQPPAYYPGQPIQQMNPQQMNQGYYPPQTGGSSVQVSHGNRLNTKEYKKKNEVSQQEKMTDTEIKEKLENYEPVDDIKSVGFNTHIRYFIKSGDGKWKFRLGGFLKDTSHPDYVMLSTSPNNDGKTWTASKTSSKFYKIKSPTQRKKEQEQAALTEAEKTNKEMMQQLAQQQQLILDLQKQLGQINKHRN